MQKQMTNMVNLLITAVKAGEVINEIYSQNISVEIKKDNSPLTIADKRANDLIVQELRKSYPNIPIISEESSQISYDERKKWNSFWLVDPLDGTKEFIKKNGEFTVNIALIENNEAIIGVIYAPVLETLYFAQQGFGSFRLEHVKSIEELKSKSIEEICNLSQQLPIYQSREAYSVVVSRSHLSPETEEHINKLKQKHKEVKTLSRGSSLKLCLVAEGKADEYPRFGPTMEWDTAAGQAIVNCAGSEVIDTKDGKPLRYNKDSLLNNWFIAQTK